jgi:hypothetical protein
MVFGLFEGNKIDISLDKPAFNYGESVTGKVLLDMKGAKKAKQLRIQFYFEYETMSRRMEMRGNPPREVPVETKSISRIAEQTLSLDGEKEYPAGHLEYPFKFNPTLPASHGGGWTRDIGWMLNASLDVPMQFDVNKTIRVAISMAPQMPPQQNPVAGAPPDQPPWAQQPGSPGNQQQPPWVP